MGCEGGMQLRQIQPRLIALLTVFGLVSVSAASLTAQSNSNPALEMERYEQALREREKLLLQAVPVMKETPKVGVQNGVVEKVVPAVESKVVASSSEQSGIAAKVTAEMKAKREPEQSHAPERAVLSAELEGRLMAAHNRITELLKELDLARRRLTIAETEVERLSTIIEGRNMAAASGSSKSATVETVAARAPQRQPAEMPIATITVSKANLRTGPGTDNSPLMTVSHGTRLAVETRQGDWYRVITPTGTRAWVSGDVIAFGAKEQWSPSETVRIGGYDLQAEEAAFALISKGIE